MMTEIITGLVQILLKTLNFLCYKYLKEKKKKAAQTSNFPIFHIVEYLNASACMLFLKLEENKVSVAQLFSILHFCKPTA